ncbi:GRAS family transcription factor isoform 1 [Hibiscus syriacus]|uniref:GRAS family transcription factor isoform 1 n=1 Tax=Hibiscus syriacus TaxID=106335 RepID=A0A6A3CZS7_HIBSY|nr:GRAS family transcription factor isoform 1 [Hibiscus syriacus]
MLSQPEKLGNASSMITKMTSLSPSPLPGMEGSSPVALKKQLEHSQDGKMVNIVYFGQHDHPKPLNHPLAVDFGTSVVEEQQYNSLDAQTPRQIEPTGGSQPLASAGSEEVKGASSKSIRIQNVADSDYDHLNSKRRKKESSKAHPSPAEKPASESRTVIKTLSEVDIVNDGYRSYFRCSNPGCPFKKHVERASHDAKLVITTYEGRHDHDLPPNTKVEESRTVCLDIIVHPNCKVENNSSEQRNGKPRTKSEVSYSVSVDMMDTPILCLESGSNEQRSGKLDPSKEHDVVDRCTVVHSTSSSQSKLNEQISSKSETKSENDAVCIDKMVHTTPHSECNFDEQGVPSTAPVQS